MQAMKLIRSQLQHKRRRLAIVGVGVACFACVLIWSGIEAFQRDTDPVPLAATQRVGVTPSLGDRPAPSIELEIDTPVYEVVGVDEAGRRDTRPLRELGSERVDVESVAIADPLPRGAKLNRAGRLIVVEGKPWTGEVFDHKPIRPVARRMMKTTAYSPDEQSCGIWADGITASGKSVWMNGGRLVAADRKIPYGTILTVPGYNDGKPVQVWDRGGKIKGNRLDLLYPTHEIALQWGVQDVPVVFWEFVETD